MSELSEEAIAQLKRDYFEAGWSMALLEGGPLDMGEAFRISEAALEGEEP
jgi:hypothetical protein